MKFMPSGMELLKSDSVGRVQTPAEKRAEILREFDRSGASGMEFAKHIGVKYPTGFARTDCGERTMRHSRSVPPSLRPHPIPPPPVSLLQSEGQEAV